MGQERFRVLIAEDDGLVGLLLEDTLDGFGCETVGPERSVAAAVQTAEAEHLDFALLDLTLTDGDAYPVAEALARLGVPFAFLTGHAENRIRPEFRSAPRLGKPIDFDALEAVLRRFGLAAP